MGFLAELVAQTILEVPLDWLMNRAPRPVALGCALVFIAAFAALVIWLIFW